MRLFEINEAIENLVDHETGEILDFDQFEQLQMAREEKIENMALWIKDLRSDAEQLKAQKVLFALREKAYSNKADKLEDYLSRMLEGNKFETIKCQLSFRKSQAVEITSEELLIKYGLEIDDSILKYRDPDINKEELSKRLKLGDVIPGATLINHLNLQIK